MKILKIEFKNINSLRGEQKIDFEDDPFRTNTLFAITGPTGSGKSTILDVISLALFNMVPRVGKITRNEIEKTGAILTRNQQEAYASITYETRTGKYQSNWSISTNRNGNLRDYEMQLVDLISEKPIDLKKSEVPAKNEELIGLNYNQFIKSVLLAQGEFAQFLKVKKDERGELIEKITGTGIYRQLGRKAYEKYKEVTREIEFQQNQIKIIEEDLLEDEIHKAHTANLKEKIAACEPLEKAIEATTKSIELKQNIGKQERDISENSKNKSIAKEALKDFSKDYGERLNRHEKVQDFAEELRNWGSFQSVVSDLKEELKNNEEQISANSSAMAGLLQKTSKFLSGPVQAENFNEKLENFTKKVSQLQEERNQKLGEYKNYQELFRRETRELELDLGDHPKENQQKLEKLKTEIGQKTDALKEKLEKVNFEKLPEEKHRLKTELETAREAWRYSEKIFQTETELKKKNTEELQWKAKAEPVPAKLEELKKRADSLNKDCENLRLKRENQLMRAQLEDYRHELKPEVPCPLCGSIHHPYAENLPPKDDELEEKLKLAEKELSAVNDQLSSLNTQSKHYQENLSLVRGQKEQLNQEYESQKNEFTERFSKEIRDWEKHCNTLQKQSDNLEVFEKETAKLDAIAEGLPLLEKIGKVIAEGKEIKDKLDQIYTGNNVHRDSRELQSKWVELQQQQKNLELQKKNFSEKLNDNTSKLENLEVKLNEEIQKQEFQNIEEARKALMPDADYNQLRQKREKLKTEIGRFETSLKILNKQLEELKKRDVEKDLQELNEELQEQKEVYKERKEECQELERLLKNHEENLAKLEKIKGQIEEKEKQTKRWRLLNELIGDAQGKKFNEFAQDLTLTQLLILANKRLANLSDRYRIDKPEAEEDDGLVAIDEHMGGQRRSVKTLSGGETFILSLSMALALSDLASRNVEINSLFIDEGFGTLDPETLDQTLDTLEKLQAESSKMIGIISHVDSLKERIATQIQLERNGQGYSQLNIKG